MGVTTKKLSMSRKKHEEKLLLKKEVQAVGKIFSAIVEVVLSILNNDSSSNLPEELDLLEIPNWADGYYRPRIVTPRGMEQEEKPKIPIEALLKIKMSEETIKRLSMISDDMVSAARVGKIGWRDIISGFFDCLEENNIKIEKEFLGLIIFSRILINSLASLIIYREPIYLLYDDAKRGEDDAFFKMVALDKAIIATEWGNFRVRRATLEGDWRFFDKLSRALVNKPYCKKKQIKLAAIIMFFWDYGFQDLKYLERVEFLESVGFKENEIPEQDALRQLIHRLGVPYLMDYIAYNYKSKL